MNWSAPSKELLMVDPSYFDIAYAINPFMKTESGELKKIDKVLAREQWSALKSKFEELDLKVNVLPAVRDLPDMVFAANQSFTFLDSKTSRPTALMGRMRSPMRQPEVAYFESWYRSRGYVIEHLEKGFSFEGTGDALLHPNQNLIWGGFGHRTDKRAYDEIKRRWNFNVLTLELVRPEFYHLDTCFSILDEETVVIQKEAFSNDGLNKIHSVFKSVIEIDINENLKFFTANCFATGNGNVVLQEGNSKFVKDLETHGFKGHEVDTSEFIKAGGSVFCLKMVIIQK